MSSLPAFGGSSTYPPNVISLTDITVPTNVPSYAGGYVLHTSGASGRVGLVPVPSGLGAVGLNDLTDVDPIPPLMTGEVLTYNAGTGQWRNQAPFLPPPSLLALNDLTDVDTAVPPLTQTRRALIYKSPNSTWSDAVPLFMGGNLVDDAPAVPGFLGKPFILGFTDGDTAVEDQALVVLFGGKPALLLTDNGVQRHMYLDLSDSSTIVVFTVGENNQFVDGKTLKIAAGINSKIGGSGGQLDLRGGHDSLNNNFGTIRLNYATGHVTKAMSLELGFGEYLRLTTADGPGGYASRVRLVGPDDSIPNWLAVKEEIDWRIAMTPPPPIALSSLSDVNLAYGGGVAAGKVLTYNVFGYTGWTALTPNSYLSGLTSDVTITGPTNGQVLTYDSGTSKWINQAPAGGGATNLDGLTDVTLVAPTNGQILMYDSGDSQWKNQTPATPSLTLDNLTDVTITAPAGGQLLAYNGAVQWVNQADSTQILAVWVAHFSVTPTPVSSPGNNLVSVIDWYDPHVNYSSFPDPADPVKIGAAAANWRRFYLKPAFFTAHPGGVILRVTQSGYLTLSNTVLGTTGEFQTVWFVNDGLVLVTSWSRGSYVRIGAGAPATINVPVNTTFYWRVANTTDDICMNQSGTTGNGQTISGGNITVTFQVARYL